MKVLAVACLLVASAMGSTIVRFDNSGYSSMVSDPIPVSYGGYGSGAVLVRSSPLIPITRFNQEIRAGLSDVTDFETGNGIRVSEQTKVIPGTRSSYQDEYGRLVESDSSLVKSGSYSYTGNDGIPISLSWTADESGFRATGAHLPTPPPMPAELVAAYREASMASSYAAPLEVRSSYSAPVVVRSSYAAPALIRSAY